MTKIKSIEYYLRGKLVATQKGEKPVYIKGDFDSIIIKETMTFEEARKNFGNFVASRGTI
jgi:thiamine pyrophosphokinase